MSESEDHILAALTDAWTAALAPPLPPEGHHPGIVTRAILELAMAGYNVDEIRHASTQAQTIVTDMNGA